MKTSAKEDEVLCRILSLLQTLYRTIKTTNRNYDPLRGCLKIVIMHPYKSPERLYLNHSVFTEIYI